MTPFDLITSRSKLLSNDYKYPKMIVEHVLASVSGVNRQRIYTLRCIDSDIISSIDLVISKINGGMPWEYAVGSIRFFGVDLDVCKDVLIPRIETEEMCAFAASKMKSVKSILDMCTGSGAIGISLARLFPNIDVTLSDISPLALSVAKKNAGKNKVKVSIVESDLFNNIEGVYDIIVCNPPYVSSSEYDELDNRVVSYEPQIALTDFRDGLTFYHKIAARASNFLKEAGMLLLEIGKDQGSAVADILKENKFKKIAVHKDLMGHDRYISCIRS